MKASKFSDAQKAFILKQGEDGVPVAEICWKSGLRSTHWMSPVLLTNSFSFPSQLSSSFKPGQSPQAMACHYAGSLLSLLHRLMRLTAAFARLFGLFDDKQEGEHDLASLAVSETAKPLGMPERRQHGDDMDDMDHSWFVEDEAEFIRFAKMLDARNEQEGQ